MDIKKNFIPNKLEINSLQGALDLHNKIFIPYRKKLLESGLFGFMPHYRGEQKLGWDIVSGIFRPPNENLTTENAKNLEKLGILEFENKISNYFGESVFRNIFYNEKFGKNWDLLFQAQHGGVKTTLTDWTGFIKTALYFATEKSNIEPVENSDAQIWCLMIPDQFVISDDQIFTKKSIYNLDPYNINQVYIINPPIYLDNLNKRIFENRMYKQGGRFLVLPRDICDIPINKNEIFNDLLFHIRIPKEFKYNIRQNLINNGFTKERMYSAENPILDDIINEINKKIFSK